MWRRRALVNHLVFIVRQDCFVPVAFLVGSVEPVSDYSVSPVNLDAETSLLWLVDNFPDFFGVEGYVVDANGISITDVPAISVLYSDESHIGSFGKRLQDRDNMRVLYGLRVV